MHQTSWCTSRGPHVPKLANVTTNPCLMWPHYVPYAYCSLDKGIAYTKGGGGGGLCAQYGHTVWGTRFAWSIRRYQCPESCVTVHVQAMRSSKQHPVLFARFFWYCLLVACRCLC